MSSSLFFSVERKISAAPVPGTAPVQRSFVGGFAAFFFRCVQLRAVSFFAATTAMRAREKGSDIPVGLDMFCTSPLLFCIYQWLLQDRNLLLVAQARTA